MKKYVCADSNNALKSRVKSIMQKNSHGQSCMNVNECINKIAYLNIT
jgi:hypothetical protein